MTTTNCAAIAHACDLVARRCTTIAGTMHGSAWLFDQVMRAFDFKPCVSVTYDVYINLVGNGQATIDRDGNLTMCRI